MDDMTAFERQVGDEIFRIVGPARPVDDLAVFEVAANASPKWRFQSMFSATKFVVAGAIVALFGGFLLSGVLTQPPSDDRLPAVGASASATAQAEPTDAATTEPEPTSQVEADDTTTPPDLLPGVDLVTEAVKPGVYRVLSDGVRDIRRVQDVAVTPTGDVWVEQGTSRDWDIIRLGEPGVSRTLGREAPWDLFTLDGAPTVARPGIPVYPPIPWRTFDGESWVDHEPTGCDHQQRWLQGGITADGQCWAQLDPFERGVYPIDDSGDAPRDDSGEARSVVLDGVGSTLDRFMSSVDVTDDGTLWATVHSSETSKFEGLVRYDGETWEFIPYDAALQPEAETGRRPESHIALGPDGRVWAVDIYQIGTGNKSAFVVRVWDGEDWMTLGPVEAKLAGRGFGSSGRTDARFLDDGSVWLLDGLLVVDDDGLRTQDLPGVPGVEFGPDGSAWTIAGGALYVITPEAVATTE